LGFRLPGASSGSRSAAEGYVCGCDCCKRDVAFESDLAGTGKGWREFLDAALRIVKETIE